MKLMGQNGFNECNELNVVNCKKWNGMKLMGQNGFNECNELNVVNTMHGIQWKLFNEKQWIELLQYME